MTAHLALNLLPSGLFSSSDHKMIYVARNPKDAAISWYHHFKGINYYNGSLEELLDCYVKGENIWGSYFQHLNEFLRLSKVVPNLLVVTYEELVSDPHTAIRRIADYLDIPVSDDNVAKVADYIHFDKMKSRKSSNREGMLAAMNRDEKGWTEKGYK